MVALIRIAVPTLAAILILMLSTAAAYAGEDDALNQLLSRLAGVADEYRDRATHFACEETINWTEKKEGSGHKKFGYVFVRDDATGFRDYRTFLRGKNRREVTPEEFGVPAYLQSAYIWVFVFKTTRQERHRYEIVEEGMVLDRPAVKIRFDPIPPHLFGVNEWFGWAWVDKETSQLLKVVAYEHADWESKSALEADLNGGPRRKGYQVREITTTFDVVENGMRFPGSVETVRTDYDVYVNSAKRAARAREIFRVEQSYRDYQFYGVETDALLLDEP